MKLRRVLVENIRSFLEPQEWKIPGDISIIIGPNGGGKTNLLDAATTAMRLYLLKSWVPRHNPSAEWQDRYDWTVNELISSTRLEKHSRGSARKQRIELDIEVTKQDVDNLKLTKAQAALLLEKSKTRYTSFPAEIASKWELDKIAQGLIFTYRIIDNSIQGPLSPEAETFRQYLEVFEVDSRLRSEHEITALSTPMITLPVNRSSAGISNSVSLADFNEGDQKRSVDAASSRSAPAIVSLAIGRLARRFRHLLERDKGGAKESLNEDPSIKSFTSTLKSLGYEWHLECVNVDRNQYDIRLIKQGSSFLVGAASSGERELLIYLFAIYALNVRDALIVIDEPELHLHPRWQKTLLSLFERLSLDTGNQFLMATHSPVFVSPSSIQYVSRVSSIDQQSRIIRLGDSALPEEKHLFNIVNSQNNERIFFADKVVLVEGPSDRIFIEALLRRVENGSELGAIIEVVSVGGKGIFSPYKKLLEACRVPHCVVADLDYLKEIGGESMKKLFHIKAEEIKRKVVDDPASFDGSSLLLTLDEAISTKDVSKLYVLWEYIKDRRSRLRVDFTADERLSVDAFICTERLNGLFILSRGALEAYLPLDCRNKDMEKVIKLTSAPDFWEKLPSEVKPELELIISGIKAVSLSAAPMQA